MKVTIYKYDDGRWDLLFQPGRRSRLPLSLLQEVPFKDLKAVTKGALDGYETVRPEALQQVQS